MPRRRASKGNAPNGRVGPRKVSRKDGSIKRWNKAEDIPLDEVDQFHEVRDRILLEGEQQGHDEDGDEEEVFALQGMDSSGSDDGNGDGEGSADDGVDAASSPATKPKQPKSSSKVAKKAPSTSSDSEEELEEEEGWGSKKSAYYSSNAGVLESDDEEANEMEEQEARRLQAKLRDAMVDGDFGLADAVEVSTLHPMLDSVVSKPPVALPQDKQSRLQHLQKTSPETIALAQEWDDVVWSIIKTKERLKSLEANKGENDASLGMVHLFHHTQLTYASVLAFYLHMRASEKYAARPELLKTHPILTRLLSLKQSLSTLEELDFGLSDAEDESDGAFEDESDASDVDLAVDAQHLWALARKEGLDENEIDELLREAGVDKPARKSNLTSASTKLAEKEPPKKKQKTAKADAVATQFDLIEPEYVPSESAPTRVRSAADAYGEATVLDTADAADKSARRKTLRFHTAKIEGASARRLGARNAVAGDDDIPYRDRRKEQLHKKIRQGLGEGGDDLDDRDPEPRENGKKRGRVEPEEEEDEEGDDGYYDLVKKQKTDKKEKKKTEREAVKQASWPDMYDDLADGQRSITRSILANKGLTPHRSKSVRNPRVKKRMRFEKAKKKIASQKAVYKGGIGDTGRYEGERSGITKVVKSVKF